MYGIAQEYVKPKKASKIFQAEKGRTAAECVPHKKGVDSSRWKHIWSQEEDDILTEMVTLHGSKNWSTIARDMPGRNGNQCRNRDRTRPLHHDDAHNHLLSKPSIQNYYISRTLLTAETVSNSETYKGGYCLDPAINRHVWSEQEDIALIRAHQVHGNKWSELAKLFPGRTGKSIQSYWNRGMKRKLNSYLSGGLLEEFQNLSDGTPVLNSRGSSTLKGSEDSSKNNQLPSDLRARPDSKQGLTETGENATTPDGQSSDSASAKGFGARSVEDPQKMVYQQDTSRSPVRTNKKTALSPSSTDLKVRVAAPSFVRSLSEEKQMSSSCPPEALLNCANKVLSQAHSSQSTDAHFDEMCSGADKESAELHQADIADLLDMSYFESLMVIPPDSPQHI